MKSWYWELKLLATAPSPRVVAFSFSYTQSIWGQPFKDELRQNLLHDARGVLSMANAGPHSNGSQFFILYRPAPHLNQKATIS